MGLNHPAHPGQGEPAWRRRSSDPQGPPGGPSAPGETQRPVTNTGGAAADNRDAVKDLAEAEKLHAEKVEELLAGLEKAGETAQEGAEAAGESADAMQELLDAEQEHTEAVKRQQEALAEAGAEPHGRAARQR